MAEGKTAQRVVGQDSGVIADIVATDEFVPPTSSI